MTAAKDAARRLLAPALGRQTTFNRVVAAATLDLRERTSLLVAHGASARDAAERAAREVERALRVELVEVRARLARLEAHDGRPAAERPGAGDDVGDEARRARARRHADRLRGCRSVLDLAAGDGVLLDALAAAGIPARGVTADADAAGRGRARGLALEHGDAAAELVAAPDGAFDAIVGTDVATRLPEAIALVRGCRRALAPGGRLVLESAADAIPAAVLAAAVAVAGFRDVEIACEVPAPAPGSPADPAGTATDILERVAAAAADVAVPPGGRARYTVVARRADPAPTA